MLSSLLMPFNFVNLQAALRNISVCTVSTILMVHLLRQFTFTKSDRCTIVEKGGQSVVRLTTQGDPLAMGYVCHCHYSTLHQIFLRFANDNSLLLESWYCFKQWWKLLLSQGPLYGYNPKCNQNLPYCQDTVP